MKKYSHWYDWFLILINPKYWMMNDPYSKLWDIKLNYLMENNKFKSIDHYTAFLGNNCIWISNHPYASFELYNRLYKLEVRPSRITILRAHRKLVNDYIDSIKD